MRLDDPAALDFMRRSLVARIATVSRNGRPSITPLYFVCMNGHIWLGTASWTLAAREAQANARVSVLLERDGHPNDRRILRVTGRASVQTNAKTLRSSNFRTLPKYILTPGGIRNYLAHPRQLRPSCRYHAQSAEKGPACVINVTPEQFEFFNNDQNG
jgi:Pyridoxamine 5'-phosphate oxidase